jgi:hypothetical protein
MIISYNAPVMTRLGFKQIPVTAHANDLGDNRVKISKVLKIDCDKDFYAVDKIGGREVGKVKLLKSCKILEV